MKRITLTVACLALLAGGAVQASAIAKRPC